VRAFVGRINQQPAAPYVEVLAPDWLSPEQARKLAERLVAAAQLAEKRMAAHERKMRLRRLPKGDVIVNEDAVERGKR
jgi:hypothetical protein